jgi:hypothetical protein
LGHGNLLLKTNTISVQNDAEPEKAAMHECELNHMGTKDTMGIT